MHPLLQIQDWKISVTGEKSTCSLNTGKLLHPEKVNRVTNLTSCDVFGISNIHMISVSAHLL